MFKVLIVEDSLPFLEAVRGALQQKFPFVEFEQAADVEQAQRVAATFQPDLVFVDVRLADESGLELTRRLKAAQVAAPVVVLTSYDLPEYKHEAFSCGADHFLVKGQFQRSEMVSLVESILPERMRRVPEPEQRKVAGR